MNVTIEKTIQATLRRMDDILESYEGFVYLPGYYRATPPRIFFHGDSIYILVKEDRVFNPSGYSYDLAARGFKEMGEYAIYLEIGRAHV